MPSGMKSVAAVIYYLVLASVLFASTYGIAYAIAVEVRKPVAATVTVAPHSAPAIAGDVDVNGVVNIIDLGLVASNFNSAPPGYVLADINRDGLVDIYDLVRVGINFGRTQE